MLGFCEGEEGKVTGLAALDRGDGGNGAIDLGEYISVDAGELRVKRRKALRQLRAARAAGKPAAALAAALQKPLERAVEALARHYLVGGALRRLSVAGGLFANVSLNRRLAALDLDSFTVFPAMTDQGLCVGAALLAAGLPLQGAMESVRLGPDISIAKQGPGPDPAGIAARLAAGEIIGVVRGRLEFGPRALGGRSILFDPRRGDNATRIGDALGRDRCMPFAPILLGTRWTDAFTTPREPILRASREMTLALPVRRSFAEAAPAAVHVDGTARPQAIDHGDDAWLVSVLERFHALTGCCALVNTSFNLHREPIVCTADDALLTAQMANVDAVVLGDRLIELSVTQRATRSA
jgi:carbamoyltransferase